MNFKKHMMVDNMDKKEKDKKSKMEAEEWKKLSFDNKIKHKCIF